MKYIHEFKYNFLNVIVFILAIFLLFFLVVFVTSLFSWEFETATFSGFLFVATLFIGIIIGKDIDNAKLINENQIAVKFEGEVCTFLKYKKGYYVLNADKIMCLEKFNEAREEKMELISKTRDGKDYSLGVAIIKYHIRERTDQEIHTYLKRYVETKKDVGTLDINKEFKESVEERFCSISLYELERDLGKILREEARKIELRVPYYIKVHAYYY